MPKTGKKKPRPAAKVEGPAAEAASTEEEAAAASPAGAASAPSPAAEGDDAAAAAAVGGADDGAVAAAAAPQGPPPHAGDVIWHCWGKNLWWPAYLLEAAELPETMRDNYLNAATGALPEGTVALYYYGTHDYFLQKRSVLAKKWKPADKLPPPRGDPEADANLKKALEAHALQLKHNELLQLDFEYEEERAAEKEQAEAAGETGADEIWIMPKDPNKPKRPINAYMVFSAEMRTQPKFSGGGFGAHIHEIAKAWGALPAKKKAKYQSQVDASTVKYNRKMEKYTPLPLERIANPTEQQKKKFSKQIRKAPTKRKREELLKSANDPAVVIAVAQPSDGVSVSPQAGGGAAAASADAEEEGADGGGGSSMPARKKRRTKSEAGVKRARSAYNFFAAETVRQLAVTQQGKSMGELSKLVGPQWQQLSSEEREKYDELASSDRERYSTELAKFNANKEEALRKRAADRLAEDEVAKARKLVIKQYRRAKLNQKQKLLMAIEEMRVYQEGLLTAAQMRKAKKVTMPRVKRETLPSEKPVYEKIRANNYLCQKPPIWKERAAEGQECDCEPDSELPCVDDSCVNRAMYWECDKKCPAGDGCQNHRFSKRQYADVKPFKTAWKGWGLKAGAGGILSGAFLMEYVGEVLDVHQCESRLKEYKSENRPLYLHVLNDYMVIDAGVRGNFARFINHSCEPNCTTIRWVVHGEDRIGIFALRDIADDEEITIDYSWSPSQVGDQPCYCGTPSCTGFIGEKAFYDSCRAGNLHGTTKAKKEMMINDRENGLAAKDDHCFVCGDGGSVICCDIPNCSKVYHRACLDPKHAPEASGGASVRGIAMKKVATMYMNGNMSNTFANAMETNKTRHWEKLTEDGGAADDDQALWRCPWHFCNCCNGTSFKGCAKCPSSFCHEHGNADGDLEPFGVASQGKRLRKVHTYKEAAQQENAAARDQAASAGRHGGVQLCRECVHRGYDRDGERVWARVRGFPWWPATIQAEPKTKMIRNHLGRIHVVFSGDGAGTGWCTLQDIKDFEEGYEELKDVIPYKTKTETAKGRNKWYKISVKEAWDELHGTDEKTVAAAATNAAAAAPPAAKGGRGGGRGGGRAAARGRGGKGRGRGGGGRGKGVAAKAAAASSAAASADPVDPAISEAIRRSLSPDAQHSPRSKRQRGEAPQAAAAPAGKRSTRGRA